MSQVQTANYPRDNEDENVETYSTIQWCILFFAATASNLLVIARPSMQKITYAVWSAETVLLCSAALALWIAPLYFGRGQLFRIVRDRLAEPCKPSRLLLASLPFLAFAITPFILNRGPSAIFVNPIRDLQMGQLSPSNLGWTILRGHVIPLVTVLGASLLVLLILAIPKTRGRWHLFILFAAYHTFTTVSAMVIQYELYGISIRENQVLWWCIKSVGMAIAWYTIAWALDRDAFPSFRPIVVVQILNVIYFMFFRPMESILAIVLNSTVTLVVLAVIAITNPGVLRWPWKEDDEALKT